MAGTHDGGLGPRPQPHHGGGVVVGGRSHDETVGRGGGRAHGQPTEVRTPPVRTNGASPGYWLPDWVRQHVDRNSPVRELVEEAVGRAVRSPHESSLVEVQTLMNELGRSPHNAGMVRAVVNQASKLMADRPAAP